MESKKEVRELKLPRQVKNISNHFIQTHKPERIFDEIARKSEESVFGMEILATNRDLICKVITPPQARTKNLAIIERELSLEGMDVFEGHLIKPFFLPLHRGLKGYFIKKVKNSPFILEKGERIIVQWLFRRVNNWKHDALGMYDSYLKGNDYPTSFKLGRVVQDKMLETLNTLSSIEMSRSYIEEVERKILSEGFQFQLLIGIRSKSKNRDKIIRYLERALIDYDSHNAIRLSPLKDKKIGGLLQDCILSARTSSQIISQGELVSLIGGREFEIQLHEEDMDVNDYPDAIEPEDLKREVTAGKVVDAVHLLPELYREVLEAPKEVVSDIAEALKRVGLISAARLYNEEVLTGVRLSVVQCAIPKGKTLTQIQNKQKDIQAALGILSLGVEQGELPDTMKFTIPNESPAIISLRELMEDPSYTDYKSQKELVFVAGIDEINNPIYLSLSELVHLLVAGTTGSGKSVFINSVALSLMISYAPDELQMYMIDPKEVELQNYKEFPHVREVVTDMNKAANILNKLTKEMDIRYKKFSENGVKGIQAYNQKMKEQKKHSSIPYVVCIIDEYADLKDTNPEVEDSIGRLGQKARAAGIHLIIATQRPSTDIISGRIKAVIPNAISFNLNNNTNYKTVFGTGIPYSNLLGKGDGVMQIVGFHKDFQRFQSAIITTNELEEERVFKRLATFLHAKYSHNKTAPEEKMEATIVAEDISVPVTVEPVEEVDEMEFTLGKLKQIIADTGETRAAPLREKLGVKASTVTYLMGVLVEEGWLIKHESRSKGYEIIVAETVLKEWRSKSNK